ncbi:Site-specific recombinase XerD [Natronorubrum sediminis]|uniref:Site-specific recombinase XerD n=1 Tax=Natronorubrum sediminis TaxID=640943 RepID=A0A1H6FSC4_9EURY|nr:site-specific integrase [Natronorubrum sediminis]SEH13262.1 Site-specific recombinase XerD [Natronorubrum sediminis]
MVDTDGIKLVPEPSREWLNDRQVLDYKDHRKKLVEWLLVFGKDPDMVEGYAEATVKNTAARLDKFYRWTWNDGKGYTTEITHSHANDYMKELARRDESDYSRNNTQSSIKRLFKYKHHERNSELWEPDIVFTEPSGSSEPRDFLTREERGKIREAALEYGSIPAYSDLTAANRDKWKAYLAQRFSKNKSDVTPDDWKRANSWKFPSMVWVSLDAGLRPVEVERAKTTWIDIDNAVLRIPKEESSKNEGHWTVGLQDRTAKALDRWLEERKQYDLYEGTDQLWLTRFGNPYQTSSLRQVLEKLFEIAEIPTENRQVSWYTIRHSVGTYMTREEGLAAAQAQLRHKSERTTIRYDQTPVEDRRDALNRMG